MNNLKQKSPDKVWSEFQARNALTARQLEQFQKYETILTEWNKQFNLTAIHGTSEIVDRHFEDSLMLRTAIDLNSVKVVADVGSGAGFPGIPLKIMFPHLGVILIEVTKKKQQFLREVIKALELENIDICDLDWRTFLRKTESKVEYFLTRASLDPAEMVRMFRPGCGYKDAQIIYWASQEWQPAKVVVPYVLKEVPYVIKRKHRRLIFLGLK